MVKRGQTTIKNNESLELERHESGNCKFIVNTRWKRRRWIMKSKCSVFALHIFHANAYSRRRLVMIKQSEFIKSTIWKFLNNLIHWQFLKNTSFCWSQKLIILSYSIIAFSSNSWKMWNDFQKQPPGTAPDTNDISTVILFLAPTRHSTATQEICGQNKSHHVLDVVCYKLWVPPFWRAAIYKSSEFSYQILLSILVLVNGFFSFAGK